ncbi:MAG: hypothetical protein PVJ67_02290 [Candidatus Pacearchaeota archaeon]
MEIEEMLNKTKGNYLIDLILIMPKDSSYEKLKDLLGEKYKFCMFDYFEKTYPNIFIRGPRKNLKELSIEAKTKGYKIEFIKNQSPYN